MIILINGAYGCGKSTIAKLLVDKLENSLLFDPEEVGYMMASILKGSPFENDFRNVPFLEVPLWRQLVPSLAQNLQQSYKPNLVMPMTMYQPAYFKELIETLRRIDPEVQHFCLIAPLETIYERLRHRGEQQENDWPFQQAKLCVEALASDVFEEKIDTDHRTPGQITQYILSKLDS